MGSNQVCPTILLPLIETWMFVYVNRSFYAPEEEKPRDRNFRLKNIRTDGPKVNFPKFYLHGERHVCYTKIYVLFTCLIVKIIMTETPH